MTICKCVGYCKSLNYSLAAPSYGRYILKNKSFPVRSNSSYALKPLHLLTRDCHCTNNPWKNVTENRCDRSCTGDSSAKCGGYNYCSVYGTGL